MRSGRDPHWSSIGMKSSRLNRMEWKANQQEEIAVITSNIRETMNPLLSFASLSSHIDHSIHQLISLAIPDKDSIPKVNSFHIKLNLCYSCCLDSGAENILLIWKVIAGNQSLEIFEVAAAHFSINF